jgi:hypothetical protein
MRADVPIHLVVEPDTIADGSELEPRHDLEVGGLIPLCLQHKGLG